MRLIDEHWIAYPEFLAGKLSFARAAQAQVAAAAPGALSRCDLFPRRAGSRRNGVVADGSGGAALCAGGAGRRHGASRRAQRCGEISRRRRDSRPSGIVTAFVGPADPGAAGAPVAAHFRTLGALAQSELVALMRHARLVVANGGSTLLQAIACGAACVAVPIAGDQRERIRRCVRMRRRGRQRRSMGTDIAARAAALLGDEPARAALGAARSGARARRRHRDRVARARPVRRIRITGQDAMPNVVLLGYDPNQPSFRHRMQSLVAPLEAAGWQVRLERFPSGRYGLRTWERRELLGWARRGRAAPDQTERARGALWSPRLSRQRVFDVDDAIYVRKPRRLGEPRTIRRGAAGNSRATCRSVDVVAAGNEVLAGVARPAARGSQILPTSIDVACYRPTTAGRGCGAHHRLDRKPRESRLPGNDPPGARAACGAPSRAQSAGDLLGVSRLGPRSRSSASRGARPPKRPLCRGAHRHHAADRRCVGAGQMRVQIAAVHGRLAAMRGLAGRREHRGGDRRLQRLPRRNARGLGAQPREADRLAGAARAHSARTAASTCIERYARCAPTGRNYLALLARASLAA